MQYPTLEQIKSFEVGKEGLFLIKFKDLDLNLIRGATNFTPAHNVSYDYIKLKTYNLTLGEQEVSIPSGIEYPQTITIEILDNYKEDFYNKMIEWYKSTSIYISGRVSRDLLVDTKKITVYKYDDQLEVISKNSCNISVPTELTKSYTSNKDTTKRNFTFNIIGNINFLPKP